MIKSMTGYGVSVFESDEVLIQVEVKSLNSKFMDLSLKLPKLFSDKELEVRNLIADILERGKVSVSLDYIQKGKADIPVSINEELFEAYYFKYKGMAEKVGASDIDLFKLALQSPNVSTYVGETGETSYDWDKVKEVIRTAAQNCNQFREDEGNVLQGKLGEYIDNIALNLHEITKVEGDRAAKIKHRIKNNFAELIAENGFDENRYEQELIYYLEKLDINEEIVRLSTHLDYFQKTLDAHESQGKKLGFISQEIGREINTIGSKANDASLQRYVVAMKDELEKIKEQSLNVL